MHTPLHTPSRNCRTTLPIRGKPGLKNPVKSRVINALAKRLCLSYPVLAECREHASAAEEQYGIWGGMSEF
ncbi:WhiB family transcriptional regulator [Nocardia mangyaensis]|uniref:WhiB family transcriptional regulator n=1 Tax=Nocardia mangyaensis TaxID=2213200 RepID=UPI000A0237D7|nr:WhiB family transcriptional regulator [Nocardia mangyaensis]